MGQFSMEVRTTLELEFVKNDEQIKDGKTEIINLFTKNVCQIEKYIQLSNKLPVHTAFSKLSVHTAFSKPSVHTGFQ